MRVPISSVSYGYITLISELWEYDHHQWAMGVSPSSVSNDFSSVSYGISPSSVSYECSKLISELWVYYSSVSYNCINLISEICVYHPYQWAMGVSPWVNYGCITLISKLWVYHSHKWAMDISPSSVSYGHTTLITELRVSIMGGLDPKNELIVTWWSHIVL